jgi:Lon protease-like protein
VPEELEAFPLFPLGLVLLPGETLPLHIFEERYKTMINECLASDTGFGVIWLSDDGLREVGCTATITQLLERADDGRMNILTEGEQPFRLLRRVDHLPYPAGDLELLEDEGAPAPDDAGLPVWERYADLVERATDTRPDLEELEAMDAWAMAGTIEFPPDAKQTLLELRSEGERLATLAEMLDVAMKRLDFMEAAGERARSNGKVRIGELGG